MAEDARNLPGEQLRQAMRRWAAGVSIVTSRDAGLRHGMTVNSFTSISLDPPLVVVTLANDTRTHTMVQSTGAFGVTILAAEQQPVSDVFAGKVPDGGDRFAGLDTFELSGQIPLISGGLAAMVCRVVASHPFLHSTLFIGAVEAVWHRDDGDPLIYTNRGYHRLSG